MFDGDEDVVLATISVKKHYRPSAVASIFCVLEQARK